jgi:hypothetical protein
MALLVFSLMVCWFQHDGIAGFSLMALLVFSLMALLFFSLMALLVFSLMAFAEFQPDGIC